jgi:predicted amidophosphoribosyltransferase
VCEGAGATLPRACAGVRAAAHTVAASLAEGLAELVAPTRCAGCELPGVLLCERCRAAISLIDVGAACPRCGAPGGARWCGECCDASYSFTALRCAGVLEPPLSRMVTLFKDAGELRLARELGGLAAIAAGDWGSWADAIVPVPPAPAALRRRGFDHTARIACEAGAALGVTVLDALRCRPRRDQRALSRRQRLVNAEGSLVPVAGVAVPPRLLVLDDVTTTGATLDAAARAALSAGAREVRGLAVGRSCG